jgi:glycosyltransferase involved in cell wall biosynthesis
MPLSHKKQALKIVYIGWGNHVHLRRWAEYFVKLGHKVTILSISEYNNRLNGVKIISLFSHRRRESLKKLEIKIWLYVLKPDLVHVHWVSFTNLLAPYNHKIPFGITAWGSDIYYYDTYDETLQKEISASLKNANFITCDSFDLQKRIEAISNDNAKVSVVQWGVDTSLFHPDVEVDYYRSSLNINQNDYIIFSPRNINPIYKIESILEAFSSIVKELDNVILIQKYFTNDKKRLKHLQAITCDLGIRDQVRWVGAMPYEQLPVLYNLADILVSVPESDGTPMALLEGMACGLPPIVSDLPSVREWVTDRRNGLVVPVGDTGALSVAILTLIADKSLRNTFKSYNLKLVNEKMSQSAHMALMENIYYNCLLQ